ncbi:MAG: type I methionyl aminopeptidase [Chloroflexi bacterium RBG_19FT_COMBO_47_9]|nr:MAG: type I methionyl aminopeptidase [Chloroflexi bacterium RBG_19FT_COMBO_47_9]
MNWERNIVIKSPGELDTLQEAGRINARALDAVRQMIRPGVTTAELDAAAEEVIRRHGASPTFKGYPGPYPYPASICVSINEQLVHGIPGKRKLQTGDIVSVDCGSTFEGFVGDSAFTAGVGEISAQAQRLIKVTEQSLYEGIKQMRAGNRIGDISAAIQVFVESAGFNVTREYTGHGVGRQMHEGPQVPNYGTAGRGQVLRQGMTIALEPMVLIGTSQTRVLPDQWTVVSADGSLTAHCEHSVAITDGEPLILTLP